MLLVCVTVIYHTLLTDFFLVNVGCKNDKHKDTVTVWVLLYTNLQARSSALQARKPR